MFIYNVMTMDLKTELFCSVNLNRYLPFRVLVGITSAPDSEYIGVLLTLNAQIKNKCRMVCHLIKCFRSLSNKLGRPCQSCLI